MSPNRVKYFRKKAGLTLEQLGDLTGLSHSQVQRIESGKRGLSRPRADVFAKVFNVDWKELYEPMPQNSVIKRYAQSGFNDDAEPYTPKPNERLRVRPKKGENIDPWRINTDAVSRAGVKRGQVRFVDLSAEAVENVKPLQCVIAQIYSTGPEGRTVTIIRQFVPPCLLITNSETVTEIPLDIDKGEAYIKGVIIDEFVPSAR